MIISFPDVPTLVSILAFLVIFLFLMGLFYAIAQRARNAAVVKKIREGEKWGPTNIERPSFKSENVIKNKVLDFLSSMGTRAVANTSTDLPADYRQMRLRFLKAGLWQSNAPSIFWGTKIFLMICLPVCFLIIRITFFQIYNEIMSLGIAIFFALLGLYLPDVWLRVRTDIRKRRILEGMPDALDLLVVCVEAGMGLDSAINRVTEEMKFSNKTLSDEFKLLTLELRAGKSRQDALRNLALRTDLEDVNSFVTLLIQTDKFGTSVTRALRVYSDTFRTKRFQRAEEIAAKLPVKLVFPCILFIFPALFVAIMGPAAIRVYQTFLQ